MIGIVMPVPIGTHAEIFVRAEFVNHYARRFRLRVQKIRYQNLGTGTKFPLTLLRKHWQRFTFWKKWGASSAFRLWSDKNKY